MIALDADALVTVADAFLRAPTMVRAELRGFLVRVVAHLQAEVVERTPKAQGHLQRSIIGDVVELPGLGMEGVVSSALNYAAPVELGTKPHWAPIEPLRDWVKAKANLEGTYFDGVTGKRPRNDAQRDAREQAVERIARRVQIAIARRGTLAVGMFHQAEAANAALIRAQFNETARRIADRLGEQA